MFFVIEFFIFGNKVLILSCIGKSSLTLMLQGQFAYCDLARLMVANCWVIFI